MTARANARTEVVYAAYFALANDLAAQAPALALTPASAPWVLDFQAGAANVLALRSREQAEDVSDAAAAAVLEPASSTYQRTRAAFVAAGGKPSGNLAPDERSALVKTITVGAVVLFPVLLLGTSSGLKLLAKLDKAGR